VLGAEPQRRPLYFQSVNIRLQKRASHGLTFVFNYIYSRLMEQLTWLNDSDPVPEKACFADRSPTALRHRHHLRTTIGKGKALDFHSRLANSLAGGWLLKTCTPSRWAAAAVVNGSSSTPGDYVYFGNGTMNLDNRQVNGPAFNTALFDVSGRRPSLPPP